MNITKRDNYVDVTKALAMLLVIRIHTEVFGEIHAPYPIIAVPLFFFLSGFYDDLNKPLRDWFPKVFLRLFCVGVIWVIISFAYLSLLSFIKDRTISISFTINNPLIAGGVTWYLFALFYVKCITWFIHKSRLPSYIIMIVLFLMGGYISQFDLPFLLDEGIAALPFYYAGMITYPYIVKLKPQLGWLAFVGFICILMMHTAWFPLVLIPYTIQAASWYPLFFIMLLFSFCTMLWLGILLSSQKWLTSFGKQTLGILVLHPLMLHTCAVILNRLFVRDSLVWIIIFIFSYFAICVASYYGSILISKHFPILLGIRKK